MSDEAEIDLSSGAGDAADNEEEIDLGDEGGSERVEGLIPVSLALRRHLLVLDVNGLLLERTREPHKRADGSPIPPDITLPGPFCVYARPHVRSFVSWALQHFVVGIWSSARARNVAPLVAHIFTPPQRAALAFVWGQEQCTFAGTVGGRHGKPVYLKEVARLWAQPSFAPFAPHNTCIVDDDAYKVRRNPPHCAIHPAKYEIRAGGGDGGGGDAAAAETGDEAARGDDELAEGGRVHAFLQRLAQADRVTSFLEANAFDGGGGGLAVEEVDEGGDAAAAAGDDAAADVRTDERV